MSEAIEQEVVESPDPTPAPIEQPADSTFLDFDKPESLTPDRIQARMGEITRKGRDRERELQAQLKESQDLAQTLKQESLEASKPLEVLAPTADQAIDDPEAFTAQQQRREQYLSDKAGHDSSIQQNEKALKDSAAAATQSRVNTFQANAKDDGLNEATLNNAVNVVVNSGIPQEIGDFLLTNKAGPKLTMELASNPMILQEIASMSPMDAAIKLNEMSQSLKQNITDPPPPPETMSGNGKASTDDYDSYGSFS